MDNLVWAIYFIDTLTSEGGNSIVGVLLFVITAFCFFMRKEIEIELDAKLPLKLMTSMAAVLFLYGALMPSKDTAYKMLAAYGVTEIAQNEEVQKIGGKSLAVLEKAMDEYLGESSSK